MATTNNRNFTEKAGAASASRLACALYRLPVLALCLLTPVAAMTEGAVKLLECSISRICDGQGQCEAGSGQAAFRMEPLQVEAGGVGSYTISYGDTEVAMNALSEVGPFIWTVGTERNALIVSSRTDWLWHQLASGPTTAATVRFLGDCSFQR